MKKILLLNYEFPPLGGGAAPVSFELAKNLAETGKYEIDVVTMGFRGLPEKEKISENFRIFRVKCWRSKKEMCHPWEQLSYLFAARKFLNKNQKKYDIIHAHFLIPTGILAVHFSQKWKIPLVITTHGSDVPGFNADRFQFLHFFTPPFLRKICRKSTKIVSPSKFLAKLIGKNIGDFSEKIQIIPNGFDESKFLPSPKKPIIFASGRFLPRKGFRTLLAAAQKKDFGAEIHLCGDGPDRELLEKMKKTSKTKIVFHGWIDNCSQEYKSLLESAGIFVLPSESENASIALLEAMSAGCAVITTSVTGCPESVGDTGVLISPKNPDELSSAISMLLKDSGMRKKLQKNARERIEKIFSWSKITHKYDTLFDEILR